jgi:hypothetical protein
MYRDLGLIPSMDRKKEGREEGREKSRKGKTRKEIQAII